MFALIFAAIALALVFAPPRLRKIGFVIVGAMFLIFVATVVVNRRPLPATAPSALDRKDPLPAGSRQFDFDKYERDKKDKEDPDAKTRIPVPQVRFDQIQVIRGVEKGTIQSIHARLYNDSSQFTLTDHSYYLVIQDCLPKSEENAGDRCTAVYDQRGWVSLPVPPAQARDIVVPLPSFPAPFKLLGTPRVELTPTDTRSYRAK